MTDIAENLKTPFVNLLLSIADDKLLLGHRNSEWTGLAPILEGKTSTGHDAIFWEHEGNRAVRQGRWKLVSRFPGQWELYDLESDRVEMNDLAGIYPEKLKKLAGLYQAWADRADVVAWEDLPKPST